MDQITYRPVSALGFYWQTLLLSELSKKTPFLLTTSNEICIFNSFALAHG